MFHENAGDFWCIVEDISVPDMLDRRGPKEEWGITEGKKRRILNLTDGSEYPAGEWNAMVIECVANEIKIWVNGDLEEAVQEDPTSAVGWRSLGVVYTSLGLQGKALAAMDTALDLQPYSVSGLYNRGLYNYQGRDYLAATTDLDRAGWRARSSPGTA